jgi:CRISPR-associated protein Csb3
MSPDPAIRINVDPSNPGQFFACCGVLELVDRCWGASQGWFEADEFCIAATVGLPEVVDAISRADLVQVDPADTTASPIEIGPPLTRRLHLDWWRDDRAGGRELKVWAGSMESFRIARAMQWALRDERFHCCDLFQVGVVTYDVTDPRKKVEPFYFDSRRAPNAHPRDVGFSPNSLQLTTIAFPAVEFFCLVGLQRCLPARTARPRVFRYHLWTCPLSPSLLSAAAAGIRMGGQGRGFEFENWYRTGQRKHKAFRAAVPLIP